MKTFALILFLMLPVTAAELLAPPLPDSSPVEEFRKLLKMNEADRQANLAARSAENRATLEAKIREYAALPEAERNKKLNALELRWYLRNLIYLPTDRRGEKIEKAPEELREILRKRLAVWDKMSAKTQKRILEDEVIDYLSGPTAETRSDSGKGTFMEAFFNLPEEQQQKALDAIQPQQRDEVTKTLTAIRQLPPNERSQTMAAFGKFAKMNEGERRVFLNKVDRWKKMSAQEKEAWRNMAKEPLPELPPLPPGFEPPAPPMPQ